MSSPHNTNGAEETALRECPFCKSPDVELRVSITDAYVACNNCGCRTGIVYLGADEASEAYRKNEVCGVWNTRPEAVTDEPGSEESPNG